MGVSVGYTPPPPRDSVVNPASTALANAARSANHRGKLLTQLSECFLKVHRSLLHERQSYSGFTLCTSYE